TGCRTVYYDLVFVLDASSSVGDRDFGRVRKWVSDLVATFDIGPDRTQVGVVVYAGNPKMAIALNQYSDRDSLVAAVQNIAYIRGNTRTGKAIRFMNTESFNVTSGARDVELGYKRLAIVLTDGRAQDNVYNPSLEAQNNGIQLYAVGVSIVTSLTQLNEIASDPDARHVLQVDDFQAIERIRETLRQIICVALTLHLATPPRHAHFNQYFDQSGFDLISAFKLEESSLDGAEVKKVKGSIPGYDAYQLTDSPAISTGDVFGKGLPDQYVFASTFRLNARTSKKIWSIMKIVDAGGSDQLEIRVNPRTLGKEWYLCSTFSPSLLVLLYDSRLKKVDKNWSQPKSCLTVGSVTLFIDCEKIGTRRMKQKANEIGIGGTTFLGRTRLYPITPNPSQFEIQSIKLYCEVDSADKAELNCCELPHRRDNTVRGRGDRGNTVGPHGPPGLDGQPSDIEGPPGPPGRPGNPGLPGKDGADGQDGSKGGQGETGLRGFPGEMGRKGDVGPIGPPGAKGSTGLEGLPGLMGEHGVKGQKGSTGAPGLAGAVGAPGKDGPGGPEGPRGPPGFPGPRGERGSTGEVGPIGSPGDMGPPGEPGGQGSRGAKGETGQEGIPGEMGAKGVSGEVGAKGNSGEKGATGEKGLPGKDGIPGQPGTPGTPIGRQGEPGIDGKNGVKGQQGSPGVMGSKGEMGDMGEAGSRGIPGELGGKGQKGSAGAAGVDGKDGSPGPMGPDGFPGERGGRGPRGFQGLPGLNGMKGSTGASGPTGPQGKKGKPGKDGSPGKSAPMKDMEKMVERVVNRVLDNIIPDLLQNLRDQVSAIEGRPGPPGAPGKDGSPGEHGPQGIAGPHGRPGARGATGPAGASGPPGEPGERGRPGIGRRGARGKPGASGVQGPPGVGRAGVPGAPGTQGPAGTPGPAGPEGQRGAKGVCDVTQCYQTAERAAMNMIPQP
uniref:VWFA domain-containing protein n=1 Tax=Ciona savignyi TaxID=51511 RepID=H2Y642_CIOSA